MPGQLTKLVYASTLALLVALSYGCKEKYEQKKLPPADTVEVALPVRKDVEVWDSYTARIEGVKSVQIRARVSGYLEKLCSLTATTSSRATSSSKSTRARSRQSPKPARHL